MFVRIYDMWVVGRLKAYCKTYLFPPALQTTRQDLPKGKRKWQQLAVLSKGPLKLLGYAMAMLKRIRSWYHLYESLRHFRSIHRSDHFQMPFVQFVRTDDCLDSLSRTERVYSGNESLFLSRSGTISLNAGTAIQVRPRNRRRARLAYYNPVVDQLWLVIFGNRQR